MMCRRIHLFCWVIVLLSITTQSLAKKHHHHTHITGYASRSPLKTIFNKQHAHDAPRNATLWVHRSSSDQLLFQWKNANATTTTLCTSVGTHGNIQAAENTEEDSTVDWIPIQGIYGVYRVPSGVVWVLITKSDGVYNNDYMDIQKICSFELVHVAGNTPQQGHVKEQARQVRLLRQALRQHNFYHSGEGHGDFTHCLQRSMTQNITLPWWKDDSSSKPDARFFWNQPCIQALLDNCPQLLPHVIVVTSAFVGIQSNITLSSQQSYDQVLISRRSRFRAGTRFTKRGADALGKVANYAETEQQCWIFCKRKKLQKVCSHVQTRGSIPLRWSSPTDVKTYRPRVYIGTDPLAQARAVRSHVLEELSLYAHGIMNSTKLVFVNLIDKKHDQGRLGRAFDAVLQAVLEVYNHTLPTTKHVWFDFHAEVKHGKWDRLSVLLQDLTPTLEQHGYFSAIPPSDNATTWTILSTQSGVVRTNCMDCLDRTNVVQSMFARYILYRQLDGRQHKKKRTLPLEYAVAFRKNPMTLPWDSGEIAHRLLWADNADAISKLYAGTPALKGDFVRTGKRTKRGALDDGMNSLQRYYLNNFLDADRQEGMDLLVGHADFYQGDDDDDEGSLDPSSLQRAARSLFLSVEEERMPFLPPRKRRRISAPGTLDLRWLPGDLQSHMKSHASGVTTEETKQALESMDFRAATDEPWWVVGDDSSNGSSSSDDDDEDKTLRSSTVNTGHVIGALVAAMQMPAATATAVVCMLGFANLGKLVPTKDK